ncbi:MAG TPA: RICIN domain-containing protein [Mycobacteriales bacterium]
MAGLLTPVARPRDLEQPTQEIGPPVPPAWTAAPHPGQDETGTFTRTLLGVLGGDDEHPAPPPVRPRVEPATATGRAAAAVERGGVRAVEGTRRLAGKVAGLRGDERTALVAVAGVLGVVLIGIVALLVVVRFSVGEPAPAPASAAAATRTATPAPSASPSAASPSPTGSPLPPAGGEFAVRHSGYCLGVPANRVDDGAQLVQRPCGAGPDTGFHLLLKPGRTDAYSLVDARTGKCVDVLGANTGDGVPVVQWECTGGDNQTFELRPLPDGSGWAQVVAGHSGKCLDVAGVSRDENAPIQQYECHDAASEAQTGNQSFKLTPD